MNFKEVILPVIHNKASVGILGGSFDPPHLCHQLLALSFLAKEAIDELWIIPCADHAFKRNLTTFHHRLAMCELAFKRIHAIRVLDIENRLPTPNYSIETINTIKRLRPDLRLMLCLGSDLITSFTTWHRAEEIIDNVTVAIFERQSYPLDDLPPMLARAHVHRGYALPNTNSQSLRELLSHDDQCSDGIDRDVWNYVIENKLYRNLRQQSR